MSLTSFGFSQVARDFAALLLLIQGTQGVPMHIQVHYIGLKSSPWMDQFISRKVSKLYRFLSPSASVHVNLKLEGWNYITVLTVHNLNNDFAFTSSGVNLYESFSTAIDMALRALGDHRKRVREKIHRRYSVWGELAA
jgi:ribosome-associated translation inhibitor RaiA